MVDRLRIGVVGLVHDHVWGILEEFREVEGAEVTCASDVNGPLLAKVKELGVKRTYESHGDLLSKEEIDGVIVYTENSLHADVTEQAAERGLHVMVEKPMAANLEQAERMLKASKRYGIKLMVNYPTAWYPTFRQAHKLADEGLIGRIYQVRYRAAHEGPKEIGCSRYFYEWLYNKELNGAGAFMDYCCYGANMCRWILGVPEKAVALGGTYVRDYLTVEDNAVLLMGYEKAMGIAEASWSQIGEGVPPRYTLIINGSEGVIAAGRDLRVYTAEKKGWETIEPSPLEKGRRNGPEHFVTCILEDKPVDDLVSPIYNRDAQAILEAGLISMREERSVYLRELEITD
ncbi:MAG: Gfo/Idh/MocA family protein [Candidatus Bathyarchaeia archaeon]